MSGVFKSIQPSQITITPFKAYKKWYGDSGSLYTKYEGIRVADLTHLSQPYAESTDTTANNRLKGSVYESVNHLFYRDYYTNTSQTFGSGDKLLQDRILYDFATMLSLPQTKTGEEILPGSIKLDYKGLISGSTVSGSFTTPIAIVDDGDGNLVYWSDIDATGSITTFYDINGNSLGLPRIYSTPTRLKKIEDKYHNYRLETERFTKELNTTPVSSSIHSWKTGIPTTTTIYNVTPVTSSHGVALSFTSESNSGAVIMPENKDIADYLNFKGTDFTIGLVMKVPSTPTTNYFGLVLEKRSTSSYTPYNTTTTTTTQNSMSTKFPYRLTYYYDYNGGSPYWKLFFEKSCANYNADYTGSSLVQPDYTRRGTNNLLTDVDYYVSLTRTGSEYYLSALCVGDYPTTDRTVIASSDVNHSWTDLIDDNLAANDSPIYIGASQFTEPFAGHSTATIEGLSFYRQAFIYRSDEHLFQVFTSGRNNLNVGNVFYSHGLLALTNPTTYQRTAPYTNKYPSNLEYRSTITIRETQVNCTLSPGEYQVSTNPTAQTYDPIYNTNRPAGFTTASGFNPYVTQVGLYDDVGNLLVVGKLNKAIRPPGNVDTTFVVKFDR